MKTIQRFAFPALLSALLLFAACSASKEGRGMKHTINGAWTLQAITAEGIAAKYKAIVFNEADASCFIGSTWTFISNNSMGTYTLSSAAGCPATTRNIRWSIYEPKDEEKRFQFKRLDDKKNPLDDNDGFRLNVASLTETNMQLKSPITFEGKAATLVYNFTKN
ncbi:MAG: hypothetical protein ABIQ88_20530 [Chitinophagaceae bacterium]